MTAIPAEARCPKCGHRSELDASAQGFLRDHAAKHGQTPLWMTCPRCSQDSEYRLGNGALEPTNPR